VSDGAASPLVAGVGGSDPQATVSRGLLERKTILSINVGDTPCLTLSTRPPEWKETNNPYDGAKWLGLNPRAADSTPWDIFDAVLTPGEMILLISWRGNAAAQAYGDSFFAKNNARSRRIRVSRDYGKYDRREAPQYYRDASGAETNSQAGHTPADGRRPPVIPACQRVAAMLPAVSGQPIATGAVETLVHQPFEMRPREMCQCRT
jgi:hypothetical protein